MHTTKVLIDLKNFCESRDGSCVGCLYATDRTDGYECRIQHITGTYPDTWKGEKDDGQEDMA